ncbi:butyrophilin subfamily 3 member A2-like [Embiotoca jacksoni]|uniref:butyrophilin subfamily 3 member A2-like n=1 Tax=Embiotoca jacksoni TaxID=100190 RepID=UPI003704C819
MFHGKGGRFGAFSVQVSHIVFILGLIHSCTGQTEVIGPRQPIVAVVGDNITLPCSLHPVRTAVDMTVEWARPDLDPRFVLVWRDGGELENKKHPGYDGRTSLFTDQLKHGNISLNLSKVKLSDEGTYICFAPVLERHTTAQLVVGAVSSPVVTISGINRTSRGVMLDCKSAGWSPEPEVLWLDAEGNLLSAGPTESVRGPDDLYTVSSRVTVEKRHSNSFTCRVQQNNINQTREVHIHLPDDFFPDSSDSSSSAPTIVGSVLGIVFILAVSFFVCKRRQNKLKKKKKKKKHLEDEEAQKEKRSNSESFSLLTEPLMETQTERDMKIHPSREGTGSQTHLEDETHQRQTNNVLIQKSPEETETQSANEKSPTERDVNEAGDENKGKYQEETNPENNLQTEGGEETTQDEDDEAEVQSVMDEDKHEELTAGREAVNDPDREKEKPERKLRITETEQKHYDERVSRLIRCKKEQENQVKELRQQLEEVEQQREETERKLQSNNSEEDFKLLLENKKHLEMKKAELQKHLEKIERVLKRRIKVVVHMTERKMKPRNEKKEIKETSEKPRNEKKEIKEISEMEKINRDGETKKRNSELHDREENETKRIRETSEKQRNEIQQQSDEDEDEDL